LSSDAWLDEDEETVRRHVGRFFGGDFDTFEAVFDIAVPEEIISHDNAFII